MGWVFIDLLLIDYCTRGAIIMQNTATEQPYQECEGHGKAEISVSSKMVDIVVVPPGSWLFWVDIKFFGRRDKDYEAAALTRSVNVTTWCSVWCCRRSAVCARGTSRVVTWGACTMKRRRNPDEGSITVCVCVCWGCGQGRGLRGVLLCSHQRLHHETLHNR